MAARTTRPAPEPPAEPEQEPPAERWIVAAPLLQEFVYPRPEPAGPVAVTSDGVELGADLAATVAEAARRAGVPLSIRPVGKD